MNELDKQVAEALGWREYEMEFECSSQTPGAQWKNGGEYYFVAERVMIPPGTPEGDEEIAYDETTANFAPSRDISQAMELLKDVCNWKIDCRFRKYTCTIYWAGHAHSVTGESFVTAPDDDDNQRVAEAIVKAWLALKENKK